MGLGWIRKVIEQTRGNKSVSSSPLYFLLQFSLPASRLCSCPTFPWWQIVTCKPFLSKLLCIMFFFFFTARESKNRTGTIHIFQKFLESNDISMSYYTVYFLRDDIYNVDIFQWCQTYDNKGLPPSSFKLYISLLITVMPEIHKHKFRSIHLSFVYRVPKRWGHTMIPPPHRELS